MEIEDLYEKFHKLQIKRLGDRMMTRDLRRTPTEAVLRHWADDGKLPIEAFKDEDDPKLMRDIAVAALLIQIARSQGMAAAMLWKLQNA